MPNEAGVLQTKKKDYLSVCERLSATDGGGSQDVCSADDTTLRDQQTLGGKVHVSLDEGTFNLTEQLQVKHVESPNEEPADRIKLFRVSLVRTTRHLFSSWMKMLQLPVVVNSSHSIFIASEDKTSFHGTLSKQTVGDYFHLRMNLHGGII